MKIYLTIILLFMLIKCGIHRVELLLEGDGGSYGYGFETFFKVVGFVGIEGTGTFFLLNLIWQ